MGFPPKKKLKVMEADPFWLAAGARAPSSSLLAAQHPKRLQSSLGKGGPETPPDGITPQISFPMLRSDSATREMLFGSCAPPSSAPELGRAFWGQLLPSQHQAGPRAHPRGRIQ